MDATGPSMEELATLVSEMELSTIGVQYASLYE
jgi:hypothetical protein